jgi:uncharacterized membrane protein YecN with MAPEG domain
MYVTPLYAALLTFWFLVLSMRVIHRRGRGIPFGDGGDRTMQRMIRGHANFAEYVPLALLMMAMLELTRTSIYVLHVLGLVLLIGRLLHGYALSFTMRFVPGRTAGTVLTFVVLIAEAVLCLLKALEGHALWVQGL